MNLRDKISSWMVHRYGFDGLNNMLVILYMALAVMNIFVKSKGVSYGSILLIFYVVFRLVSKNKERRQLENKLFLIYFNRVKALWRLEVRRIKEVKTHRFRTCTNCKKVLRLKRKAGTHTVECPSCHREIRVKIWF